MKLDTKQPSTSPKAGGSGKVAVGGFGAVGTPSKVSLPQHGGEGGDKYKGQKSDMGLKQHGGEGNTLKSASNSTLMNPKDKSYAGPGRNLGN